MNLSKLNKKTSQRESVRLEPHPSKYLPSALEARHWGATYGLFRVRLTSFELMSVITTIRTISFAMPFNSTESYHRVRASTGMNSPKRNVILQNIWLGCGMRIPSPRAKRSLSDKRKQRRNKKSHLLHTDWPMSTKARHRCQTLSPTSQKLRCLPLCGTSLRIL